MAKVIQNVALDYDTFQWLREEQIGRRHKTLSITLCEILKNYQIMVKSVDRVREQAEKQVKARQEAEEMVNRYRGQIICDK